MSSDARIGAAVLFKQAMEMYDGGRLDSAIELLDEVIAVCEQDAALTDDTAHVAAHIRLYKVYSALGRDREAGEHFEKAVRLGASAERLLSA